ncbi:hypothetical protein ACXC9Q_28770 [Kribbella sp. CWNU-51]
MEYAEFDAERRRIARAWGREITDPEQLAAAVERLREQAATVPGEADRDRAMRYLTTLDDLVAEVGVPESEAVRRASDVLLEASRPEGTPAERRARAEAGMTEIARIAAAAPTAGERDAVLEMNESLAAIVASADAARFAADPAMAPAGRIEAPSLAPAPRAAASTGPKVPARDR